MKKREKKFWKKQLQCSPEVFAIMTGERLALNAWFIAVTDEIISFLVPHLNNVTDLNLTTTDISDEGVKILSSMSQLKHLRLKDTEITASCIPEIAKLVNLETLHLGSIKANCLDLLPLCKLNFLRRLVANPQDLNHEAINSIIEKAPSLELVIYGKMYQYDKRGPYD